MDRVCRNVDSVLFRIKGMRKKKLQRGVILKVLSEHFNNGVYCYFVKNSNINDKIMFVKQIINGLLQRSVNAINMQGAKSDNKLYPITIGNRLFTALNRACNINKEVKIISCTINIRHILNIIQNEDTDVETIIQLLYKKTNSIMYFKIGDIYIGDDFYIIDIIPLNGKNTITLTNKMEIVENPPVKKKKSQIQYTRVK